MLEQDILEILEKGRSLKTAREILSIANDRIASTPKDEIEDS
jgi:hypothetical protein